MIPHSFTGYTNEEKQQFFEMQKDAARYRWLRRQSVDVFEAGIKGQCGRQLLGVYTDAGKLLFYAQGLDALDAAIDKAMEAA